MVGYFQPQLEFRRDACARSFCERDVAVARLHAGVHDEHVAVREVLVSVFAQHEAHVDALERRHRGSERLPAPEISRDNCVTPRGEMPDRAHPSAEEAEAHHGHPQRFT